MNDTPTPKQLTAKEQRFVDEYCIDFNASRAATCAGYSKKTARAIGSENLTKPHIKAAVQARLDELNLGPKETTKLITDIAKSSVNEFYEVTEVEHIPRVRKSLTALIQELEYEMEFEEEYANRAKLEGGDLEHHQRIQHNRELKILRMQMELERNPNAYRYVDGEVQLKKVAELDMVKLVQAKEKGRIKSITPGPNGTKVELYPADTALTNLARIHGLFTDKVDHSHTIDLKNIKTIKVVEVRRENTEEGQNNA